MVLVKIAAVILIAIGIGLRYWVKRRRFYRRNVAGLQEFPSYEKAVTTKFFEEVLWFTSVVLFVVSGLALLFVFLINHHDQISRLH